MAGRTILTVAVLVTVIAVTCQAVAVSRVGCPNYPVVNCFAKDPNLCQSSSECTTAGQQCCGTQCGGTKCIYPVKAGTCPSHPEVNCLRQDDTLCNSDRQCGGAQKCCGTMCNGFACQDPQ